MPANGFTVKPLPIHLIHTYLLAFPLSALEDFQGQNALLHK